jgi:hypothetical protein
MARSISVPSFVHHTEQMPSQYIIFAPVSTSFFVGGLISPDLI